MTETSAGTGMKIATAALGVGSMLALHAAGYVSLARPSGAPAATSLFIAGTSTGFAGSPLEFTPSGPSQPMSKMTELHESFSNNTGKVADDINRRNKVLKGCIDSLKRWTGEERIKLQKAEVFNYLSPLVLDVHNGMGLSFMAS